MKRIFLDTKALKQAAECLRVLSHPSRLEIIQLLLQKKRTVGTIATECDIPQNVASTHLKLLERCGFLAGKRRGKTVEYEVIEPHLQDLLHCMGKRFS